jgi:pantoate--beta-alanine ligase
MELIRTAADLTTAVHARRSAAADVGLVPTMGALHDGHASLIRRARNERETVVVSIFVNPKQFGPGEDLPRYPRDEPRDLALCDRLGVDLVWAPSTVEFYPPGVEILSPEPGPIGDVLEGAARPGHFAGVLSAVDRLFDVVGPSAAYFGDKDAQQLFLVRRMVERLALPVTLVACPTVREPDGLALSSQQCLPTPEEREQRDVSSWSRRRRSSRAGERNPPCWSRRWLARSVPRAASLARLRRCRDEATFEPPPSWPVPRRALIAARFLSARLIDNLRLPAAAG